MSKPNLHNFKPKEVVMMALGGLNEAEGSTVSSIADWITNRFHVSNDQMRELCSTIEDGTSQGWVTCTEARYQLVPQRPRKVTNIQDKDVRAINRMIMMSLGGLNEYGGSIPTDIVAWMKKYLKPSKTQVESVKARLQAGTAEGWLKQAREAKYRLVPQKSQKPLKEVASNVATPKNNVATPNKMVPVADKAANNGKTVGGVDKENVVPPAKK